MPPWILTLVFAAAIAAGSLSGASAGHHEIVLHEDKPIRHPHGLYANYGWLQPGYDYYSIATLIALKLKAALIVAAIFFGVSWWYGLYGVKGGYGGYGGYGNYGAQSKWSADHDLPPAFNRDDRRSPPFAAPTPPLPPPQSSLPPRARPRPAPTAFEKAPQHKYPAEAARAAPAPASLMQWLLKGMELVDLSFGILGPRAPGSSCRRRLACELRRVATNRPLMRRVLVALGDPLAGQSDEQETATDCASLFPGCESSWELRFREGDRHADAGDNAVDTGGRETTVHGPT